MNGFCMQKTDFPYLCIVMDDCSTDGEQEVIKNYVAKHFNLITDEETDDYVLNFCQHKTNDNCYFAVFYLKYNHYSIGKKSKKTIYYSKWQDKCKYVALCEGDDYWIDEKKLQIQVDFLEKNEGYGMCYTKAKQYVQVDNMFLNKNCGRKIESFEDFLKNGNGIPTLTTCFRKTIVQKYQEEIKPSTRDWLMGDSPMWLFFFHETKVFFFDSLSGVYRILENSASHNEDIDKALYFIKSSSKMRHFFANKYNIEFNGEEFYNRMAWRTCIGYLKKEYRDLYVARLRCIYKKITKKTLSLKIYYVFSYNSFLWKILNLIIDLKHTCSK